MLSLPWESEKCKGNNELSLYTHHTGKNVQHLCSHCWRGFGQRGTHGAVGNLNWYDCFEERRGDTCNGRVLVLCDSVIPLLDKQVAVCTRIYGGVCCSSVVMSSAGYWRSIQWVSHTVEWSKAVKNDSKCPLTNMDKVPQSIICEVVNGYM